MDRYNSDLFDLAMYDETLSKKAHLPSRIEEPKAKRKHFMKMDVVDSSDSSCTPVTAFRNFGRAHAIRPGSALKRGQGEPWTRPCIQGAKIVIIGDCQVKVNNFYCVGSLGQRR